MDRAQPSPPPHHGPASSGRIALLAAAVGLALIVAACGSSPTTAPTASAPPNASPGASASAGASSAPSPDASTGASPAPSEAAPSPSPSAPDASAEPSESAQPSPTGPAAACSGSDDNRSFYAALASSVDWAVYCAVLPAGWYVDTGSYQLAGGGRMEISYKGPGNAHFELQQGVYCTDGASACGPRDQELGTAKFGDLDGTLVSVGGSLALYVDVGSSPSWQASETGLDQATFTAFTAALALVQ